MGSIYSFLWLACFLYLILSRSMESPKNQTVEKVVEVVVNTVAPIAHTDDYYICATLDWWPPDKCDYGVCSWGKTSLLNLDLNNTILSNAVKAFSALKIRMGGTLQDKVMFETKEDEACNPFVKSRSQLLGFTDGCLPMSRWDQLNTFFKHTGAVVTFGLNALNGRTIYPDGSTVGAWDPSNAESLMTYTLNKGYSIYGWELGNELSGYGIGARVSAQQYASDMNTLKDLVERVYNGSQTKPLLLGPGGFFDPTWFTDFISRTTKTLQVVTQHIYTLGAGVDTDLVRRILNPSSLNVQSKKFSNLQQIIRNSGSPAVAWVGEAGGAYNSGRNHVTNAFAMSFWYLDQLGTAATYDTKTYCRQTLIGGNYGLLNTNNFMPNPDYYSALLWHRLMGKQVLSTSVFRMKMLRAYTHCSKQSKGITMLLINLDAKATYQVSVSTDTGNIVAKTRGPFSRRSKLAKMPIISERTREEYHLTAPNGNLRSQTILLNGRVLTTDSNGGIPPLKPTVVYMNDPVTVAPLSIAFVHMPSIVSHACKL